ncbi:hypothetical protein BDF19DRAFT_433037 [Syncephalis fuscata]|nr:hypothetical protein BDF19DRAFT_433037 [Syncephalis fuscata]
MVTKCCKYLHILFIVIIYSSSKQHYLTNTRLLSSLNKQFTERTKGSAITMDKNKRPNHSKAGFQLRTSNQSAKLDEPSWRKGGCLIHHEHTPTVRPKLSKDASTDTGSRGAPNACLFVASLRDTHFSQWGKLLDVKVFRDWQQRPYSFVQYETKDTALVALKESQGTLLDSRPIRVEPARVNRALFIVHKNARELNEPEIRELASPYGEIETLDILPWSASNQEHGLAFVKFSYRDDAIQAYLGIRISNTWCVDWANHAERLVHPNDKTSLFVGQLNPREITENKLRDRFKRYGTIAEISLINRPSFHSFARCAFSFIRYEDPESATKALAAEDGAQWLGYSISVQYREPREQFIYKRSLSSGLSSGLHPFPTTVGRYRHTMMEEPSSVRINDPTVYTIAQPPTAGHHTMPPFSYIPHLDTYYYPYMPGMHPPHAPAYTSAPSFVAPGQLSQATDNMPIYMYTPQQLTSTPVSYKYSTPQTPNDTPTDESQTTPESFSTCKTLTPRSSDQSADNSSNKSGITVASTNTTPTIAKSTPYTVDELCYQLNTMNMASQTNT